jgi:hypothetical protein
MLDEGVEVEVLLSVERMSVAVEMSVEEVISVVVWV